MGDIFRTAMQAYAENGFPDEWQRLLAALGTAGEPPPAPPDAAPSGGPIDKDNG